MPRLKAKWYSLALAVSLAASYWVADDRVDLVGAALAFTAYLALSELDD